MEIKLGTLLQVLVALVTVGTFVGLIIVAYRKHSNRFVAQEKDIKQNKDDIQEIVETVNQMNSRHEQDMRDLRSSIDRWREKDDSHHLEIRKELSAAREVMAEIKGYIFGKEKEKDA